MRIARPKKSMSICGNNRAIRMSVADDIKQALTAALQNEGLSGEASLEHPAELPHGDYATGIALAKSKEAGMNPHALAKK